MEKLTDLDYTTRTPRECDHRYCQQNWQQDLRRDLQVMDGAAQVDSQEQRVILP
jgi:hypothetical protein